MRLARAALLIHPLLEIGKRHRGKVLSLEVIV